MHYLHKQCSLIWFKWACEATLHLRKKFLCFLKHVLYRTYISCIIMCMFIATMQPISYFLSLFTLLWYQRLKSLENLITICCIIFFFYIHIYNIFYKDPLNLVTRVVTKMWTRTFYSWKTNLPKYVIVTQTYRRRFSYWPASIFGSMICYW